MNRLESIGVLGMGNGMMAGSIATTQKVSVAVLPAIFVVFVGMATAAIGLYRR